jgi:hypothetical protein
VALRPGEPVEASLNLFSELGAWNDHLGPDRSISGSLSLFVRVEGESRAPQVHGTFNLDPMAFTDKRRKPGYDTWEVEELEGAWHLGAEGLVVVDHFEGGLGRGRIDGAGSFLPSGRKLQLSLHARETSLQQALKQLAVAPTPWVDLRTDLDLSVEGTLSPLLLVGPISARTRDFVVKNGPVASSSTSTVLSIPRGGFDGVMVIDDRAVTLHLDSLRTQRSSGKADVRLAYDKRVGMDADLRLSDAVFSDFGPLGNLRLDGRGRLRAHLRGPLSRVAVDGHISVDHLRVLGVPFADHAELEVSCPTLKELRFPSFSATRGRTSYHGALAFHFASPMTMDVKAEVDEGWITDLAGMFVDLPGVEGGVRGSLDLSGPPMRLDGAARFDLADVELVGESFPEGRAEGFMRDGRFALKDLSIWRWKGAGPNRHAETLRARGSVGLAYRANFDVIGDGFRLEDLDALVRVGESEARPRGLRGDIHLDARLEGTLMDLAPHARIAMRKVRFFEENVPDSTLFVDTVNNRMRVTGSLLGDAAGVLGEVDLDSLAWHFDFDLERFPLHVARPYAASGQPVHVLTDGRLGVRGQRLEAPDLEAVLARTDVRWGEHVLESRGPWRLVREGTRLALEGFRLEGKGTKLVLDRAERSAGGQLDLEGGGTMDLAWLALLGPEILRAGGAAELRGRVSGSERKPDIHVDIQLQDALVKTVWFPNAFENLGGGIQLSPERYAFELTGTVGGGELGPVKGIIRAENWRPRTWDITGKVRGARVRYLESLPPMVADAELAFSGPSESLLLSGRIDVREMVFNERIDWESWILELGRQRLTAAAPAERGDYFSLDLQASAEGTGRIRNNVANGSLAAELRIVGNTRRPGVVGEVRLLPGARVYLKERDFEVTRGEIRFVDPYSFDPDLEFATETEIRSRTQDYRVFVKVNGPFSAWESSSTSEPSLSQADINWLLLFGATREELEDFGGLGGALAWEGVELLGHELGFSPSMVDRLSSGIFQVDRWDIVTGATARGSAAISSEPRLVVEKDVPPPWDLTLLGEVNLVQFGDTYASVERRIARRLYLTGYWASREQGRSLSIGGAFGADFSLRWELD